jgi:cell division transport system ATP-binding protein
MDRKEHAMLINIKDLSWAYPNGHHLVFDHFNFALYKGDFVVVQGKSGTGKTTLVHFLIGNHQLPARTMYHGQEDMSKFSASEMQRYRKSIGVVFQDYKLLDWLTVEENIAYPLKIAWLGQSLIDMQVKKVAHLLHLEDSLHTPVEVLSGGHKQKVGIARALVSNPEFIIADEPTGNLDREETKKVADTLLDLNAQGITVVFVTHDVHLIEYMKLKNPKIAVQLM